MLKYDNLSLDEFKELQNLYDSIETLETLFHNSNSNGGVVEWDEFVQVVENVINNYNILKYEEEE